jgi:arylsulfatase A-like enzyme
VTLEINFLPMLLMGGVGVVSSLHVLGYALAKTGGFAPTAGGLPARARAGFVLGLTLLLGACGGGQKPEGVLLVVVDTLRADHLGVYGYERPTSPHLDELAAEGAVFEQAIAPAPWTLPSVASMLTGKLPRDHGAGRKEESKQKTPLSLQSETLAEALREIGFQTGAITNNPYLGRKFQIDQGFDSFDYGKRRSAAASARLARQWIDERREQPFFLLLHLMDPHFPYRPPARYRGRFAVRGDAGIPPMKELRKGLGKLDPEIWEHLVARYDEEVLYVDEVLGELFAWLRQERLWDRTLVVVTSDHGEEFLEHGSFEHGHSMYQEVLRVPLLVWGPGVEARRIDRPVSLVDFKATLLEAVGGRSESTGQGVSFWPLLRGRGGGASSPLYAESMLYGDERKAVVDWPWKYELRMGEGDRELLFDLESDPLEQRDLAGERVEEADRLEGMLRERLLAPNRSLANGDEVELDEAEKAELRELGYLE